VTEPRRMMLFIDGENLVMRYQAMKEKDLIPRPNISHRVDTYVWLPTIYISDHYQIIRAHYYTSTSGDEEKISLINEELKDMSVKVIMRSERHDVYEHNLYPVVFRRPGNSKKVKVVDIQMTVDILSHVYQDNIDVVYLISGDGDYKAVIEEVIRRGKQVHIGAFSSGLNPVLKRLADKFIDLDKEFFE